MNETTEQSAPILTARQKRFLKGLGHDLAPVILIGKEGMSDRLLGATDLELARHELIKIRVGNNSGLEKNDTARSLSAATQSTLVQLLGKTILLYRRNPELPKEKQLVLPKG
ncbi:MAG: ribosome assembly RNA-binding protein YhbY [Desulfoprunum sp.]|jgi:RNA-binding protein|uniref:ribosome assembly RNA-binding protein YhbY n=1 Tax=Desulfoprunum sp. TaxID=2020866 RepID=UPI00068ACB91